MSTRKTTVFYVLLSAVLSFAVALVIASRLDLTPASQAQTLQAPSQNSAAISGPLDAQTFRNVAKAASPMVVNIRTEIASADAGPSGLLRRRRRDARRFPPSLLRSARAPDQQDDQPQGDNRRPREQTTVAAGTGFIISADGLIVTNNHVVDGATKIQVMLFGEDDDQRYDAKVVGRDLLTDTALIQLTQKPDHALPVAKFGDSSQMAAGDWVMAIGNPFNQAWTVTVGIISAVQRDFRVTNGRSNEMIQTDAAINPGNSGGPLLNLRGEVIGMNTAIYTNSNGAGVEGNIGIGFAVPINTIHDLLPQLSTGKVSRGRIGVIIAAVPTDGYADFGLKSRMGALVSSVADGGAAEKAGIKPGDVIVEYNGRPVPNTNELVKMVIASKPGTAVPVKILRDKKEETLRVTVDELDIEAEQAPARQGRNDSPEPAAGTAGQRQLRPDAHQPDAADGAPTAAAVRPIRSGHHGRRSGRPIDRRAATGRRHSVGEPADGHQCVGSGAGAAAGRGRPPRSDSRVARRPGNVRHGDQRVSLGEAL